MPNKTTTPLNTIEDVLANARALLAEKERELAELEQQAKMRTVRGTREIAALPPATPPASLAEQLASLLTREAQDTASAAAALGVPVGRIRPLMDAMRDALKIHNIGSEVEPRWQHVLGDDCSPADLRALVLRLISERPFSHRELCIVTGARENRISGVLADLREEPGTRVANLGNGSKGRWFLLPPTVKVAPLRRTNGKR